MWVVCKCTHTCAHSTHSHTDGVPQAGIRFFSVEVLGTHSGWGCPSPGQQPSSLQTSLQGRPRDRTGAGPRLAGGLQAWDGGTSGAWPVLSGVPSGLFHTRCPLPHGLGSTLTLNPHSGRGVQELLPYPPGGFERAVVSFVLFCLL